MSKKRVPHSVDPSVIEENTAGIDGKDRRTFAMTLNQLMEEKGVAQDEMADALGISTGSISNYRSGKTEAKLSAIIKIANYLGVDCHYLMTGNRAENALVASELGLSDKVLDRLRKEAAYKRKYTDLETSALVDTLTIINSAFENGAFDLFRSVQYIHLNLNILEERMRAAERVLSFVGKESLHYNKDAIIETLQLKNVDDFDSLVLDEKQKIELGEKLLELYTQVDKNGDTLLSRLDREGFTGYIPPDFLINFHSDDYIGDWYSDTHGAEIYSALKSASHSRYDVLEGFASLLDKITGYQEKANLANELSKPLSKE